MIIDLKSAGEIRFYIKRASVLVESGTIDWNNSRNELFHLKNLVRDEIDPFVSLCELIGTTLMNKTENRLDIKPMYVPFIVHAMVNVKNHERD
ncbi:hypothetical protein Aeh1ORF293c [Aeromonas phage Aeh1]|uniref:Uncharacterized protein n=1 Tax=Aeromonas phage Aeh1 TaxID=2880362 RepID=Q76YD3_9CAUD|nr:hypothetical protein Aeh1p312 [Aeromonas phage Aeh1]AAQ17962.1 hypothetical protein Aeh1ORF293c [Aeromonas phage Aeh1]